MESEFRVYLRLSETNPTHRRVIGTFRDISDAEDCARDQSGAYIEPWHPSGKIMVCAGRFAPGVYKPEAPGSRSEAERFVRKVVK